MLIDIPGTFEATEEVISQYRKTRDYSLILRMKVLWKILHLAESEYDFIPGPSEENAIIKEKIAEWKLKLSDLILDNE